MTDKIKINSTFERIEKSLNLRFQKKGTLFISKDNLENLKREIFNSNMQNILALDLEIKTPIVMQIILKNPWLIQARFLKDTNFKKYIRENLTAEDAKQYLNVLKDIADDNIFSSNEFKLFIEGFYYRLIDLSECERIIDENNSKPKIIVECFKRVIIEKTDSSEIKIRKIDEFFLFNQAAYQMIKNTSYLNEIIDSMDNKDYIAEWILDNKTLPKIDPVWSSAFISLDKDGFDLVIKYIKSNFAYNEVSKWIVRNVFQKLLNRNDSNVEYYIDEIVNIYRHRDAYSIKILFLDMLQPGKFKHNDMACRLLDEFENIGIADKYDDRVEKIRNGEEDRRGYVSVEGAFSDIDKPNTDTSNKKTLDYISREFNKTDYDILVQLYTTYHDNINVQRSISYYIANEMRKKSSSLIGKIGNISEEYIARVAEYISEYSINSQSTMLFLHENGRSDIIERLNSRRKNDS